MIYLLLPAALYFAAFFILPMCRLVLVGAEGDKGWAAYAAVVTDAGYREALFATLAVAASTTVATLLISGIAGVFLQRHEFPGRRVLVALMTLPLAFPGVVVGFMVIMLAGRQGLIGTITQALTGDKLVFAYSMAGLFMGYVYFSIPRSILTIMAAAEKLDPRLEEAARSLGASPWRVVRDVILPGLKPAFISTGAICFATAVGAFGTAFTLATRINVLPMVIYTEFTLSANIAMAAALSFVLGAVTWVFLAVARTMAGNSIAAAG
jgi:putative spermidine/putrescine transport system permease protein